MPDFAKIVIAMSLFCGLAAAMMMFGVWLFGGIPPSYWIGS